jgi:hypothetical protein
MVEISKRFILLKVSGQTTFISLFGENFSNNLQSKVD